MRAGVRRAVGVGLVLAALLSAGASLVHAGQDTLAVIRSRGHVACGVGDGPAGYSAVSAEGAWSGIAADFCRALAAAVIGSKDAVKFRLLEGEERLAALQAGEIDVLPRYEGVTPGRDAPTGILVAGILVYDGQGFMVRQSQNITSALELSGTRVCLAREGGAPQRIAGYFSRLGLPFEPVEFDRRQEAVAGYADKACQVLSAGLAELAVARRGLGDVSEHVILPELAAKLPVGPAVRRGDDKWFGIVRWTLHALIAAEEFGIASGSVDAARGSTDAQVRRFLGIDTDLGARLGLSGDWTQRIIKQVGNYGELFDRHFGRKSPLKLERRLNNLTSNGGLHYAPPFR